MDFHRLASLPLAMTGAKNAKVPQRGLDPCGRGRDYIRSVLEKPRPILARRIFWDVDFEKIDYDAKASFVIERVFERGDVEDIRNCRRYYGDEATTAVLLDARSLPEHRWRLISVVTNVPIEQFRCFIQSRSHPGLSPY